MSQFNMRRRLGLATETGRRVAVAGAGAALAAAAVLSGATAAFAKPGAVMSFAPSPYSYGNVEAGESASQTFTLTNTGSAASGPLTLTLLGPKVFSITANSCDAVNVAPGKHCTVTVQFAPTHRGLTRALLAASSPKSGVGTLATVLMYGTGLGHLYWVDVNNGDVEMSNVDGSNRQIIETGQVTPQQITTDGKHIYWTDGGGGQVWEANTDGSNAHVIESGQDFPNGIAVNDSQIFWSDGADGTIHSANLDGTNPQTINTGPLFVRSVAANDYNVYWAIGDISGPIVEANLDGSSAHVIEPGESSPHGLAVVGSHLYWASVNDETVFQANLDGSNPQPVVKDLLPLGGLGAMTADSSHVFWWSGSAVVYEANLDGTNQQIILSNVPDMDGMAITPG